MLRLLKKGKYGAYTFLNTTSGKEVTLVLQFFDGFDLDVGDEFTINEDLLNPRFEWAAPLYAYEVVKRNVKKTFAELPKYDVAVVKKGNKEYLLKRLYG